MSQHVIKMSVELEVIKSSIAEMQKVLDGLKPNTKAFNALNSVIQSMTKNVEKVEFQLGKGFSNNSEIKATEKTFDQINLSLERASKISKDIKFSDLKLDPSVEEQYKKLNEDLKEAERNYKNFQRNMVSNALKPAGNQQLLQQLNPDLVNKSFAEIVQGLEKGSKEAGKKLEELQNKFKSFQQKITSGEGLAGQANLKTGEGLKALLGDIDFNKFFNEMKNGMLRFRSIKGNGANGIRQQFIEYLSEQFKIPPEQLEKIKSQSAAEIEKFLMSFDNFQALKQNGMNSFTQQLQAAQFDVGGFQQLLQSFLQTGQGADQLKAKVQQLVQELEKLKNNNNKYTPPDFSGAKSQIDSFRNSLQQASFSMLKLQQQQRTFDSIKMAAMNFMGFYQVLNLVRRGVRDAFNNIKELDTIMNGIAVVTDMSTADLWDQVDAYSAMAQKYGVTVKGAYEVSKIYYQQGLETKEVMTLTEETLKLSKISGLDYATSTDYMTTALRGFKMQMSEASKVVDVYSALAANTAVSQGQLAEAMTRTASSMESVGSSFEETSAMISTIVAVTRQTASNIGSALKSIASRYGEMKKAPEDLIDEDGEALSFNKVDAALQSVGINMKTTENQFRSFTEVILQLSDKWNTLESTQQRYIATQFAGNRQQSRFLALVSNGDLLRKNLQVAETSEGTGTEQVLTTLESIEVKLNQVSTAYQQFYLNIGIADVWKGFLDGAKNALNTLNSFPKLFNKIPVVAIAAIMNVISLLKKTLLLGVSGLAQTLAPVIQSALKQTGTAVESEAMTLGARFAQKFNLAAQRGLSGKQAVGYNLGTYGGAIGSALSALSLTVDTSTREGEQTSGAMNAIGGLLSVAGGVATIWATKGAAAGAGISMIGTGLASIIGGVNSFVDTADKEIKRLTQSSSKLTEVAAVAEGKTKNLQQLKRSYDELFDQQFDSAQKAQEFQEIMNKIGTAFPQLITSIDDLGNITINSTQLENTLAAARQKSAQATLQAAQEKVKLQKKKRDQALSSAGDKITLQAAPSIDDNFISTVKNSYKNRSWNSRLDEFIYDYQSGGADVLGLKNFNQRFMYQALFSQAQFSNLYLASFIQPIEEAIDSGQIFDLTPIFQLLAKVFEQPTDDLVEDLVSQLFKNGIMTQEQYNTIQQQLNIEDYVKAYKQWRENIVLGTDQWFKDLVNDYLKFDSQSLTSSGLEDKYANLETAIAKFQTASNKDNYNSLIIAINEYSQAYQDFLKAGGDKNTELEKQIDAIKKVLLEAGEQTGDLKLAERTLLLAKLSSLMKNSKADSFYNSPLFSGTQQAILSNFDSRWETSDQVSGQDIFSQNKTKLQDAEQQWRLKLNQDIRKQLEDRYKNKRQYTSADQFFSGIIDNAVDVIPNIYKYLQDQLSQTAKEIKNTSTSYLNQKSKKAQRSDIKKIYDQLPVTTDINTIIQQQVLHDVSDYIEMVKSYTSPHGMETVQSAGTSLINSVQDLPIQIADTINRNGLMTVEGIQNSLAQIQEIKASGTLTEDQKGAVEQAQQALNDLKEKIANNLALSIQMQGQAMLKTVENQQKNLSKLQSGATPAEMQAMIKKLNTWAGKETFSSSDVTIDASGKLIFSAQSYQKALSTFYSYIQAQNTKLQTKLKSSAAIIENVQTISTEISNPYENDALKKAYSYLVDNFDQVKELLGDQTWNYFDKEAFDQGRVVALNDNWQAVAQALQNAQTNLQGQIDGYTQLWQQYKIGLERQEKWNKGNYSDIGNIHNLAQQGTAQLDQTQEKAVQTYRAGLQQLWSDILTGDWNKIFSTQYNGIDAATKVAALRAVGKGEIEDWFQQYGQQMGYTIDQWNEQFFKAYEADLQKNKPTESQAFKDIISKGQSFTQENDLYFTANELMSLAQLFNVSDWKNLMAEGTQKTVDDVKYWQLATSQLGDAFEKNGVWSNQVIQSRAENLSKLSDLVSKGKQGILEASEEAQLRSLASAFGVTITTVQTTSQKWKLDNKSQTQLETKLDDGWAQFGKAIKEGLNQGTIEIFSALNNTVSSISNIQKSGTIDMSQMQSIVDLVKQYATDLGASANLQIEDLFEYSQSLHGFVFQSQGLLLTIQALKKAMAKARDPNTLTALTDIYRNALAVAGQYDTLLEDMRNQIMPQDSNTDQQWNAKKAEILGQIKAGQIFDLPSVVQKYASAYISNYKDSNTILKQALETASKNAKHIAAIKESDVGDLSNILTNYSDIITEESGQYIIHITENTLQQAADLYETLLPGQVGQKTSAVETFKSNFTGITESQDYANFIEQVVQYLAKNANGQIQSELSKLYQNYGFDTNTPLFVDNKINFDAWKNILAHVETKGYDMSKTNYQEQINTAVDNLISAGEFFEAYYTATGNQTQNIQTIIGWSKGAYSGKYAQTIYDATNNIGTQILKAVLQVAMNNTSQQLTADDSNIQFLRKLFNDSSIQTGNKRLIDQSFYKENQELIKSLIDEQPWRDLGKLYNEYYTLNNKSRQATINMITSQTFTSETFDEAVDFLLKKKIYNTKEYIQFIGQNQYRLRHDKVPQFIQRTGITLKDAPDLWKNYNKEQIERQEAFNALVEAADQNQLTQQKFLEQYAAIVGLYDNANAPKIYADYFSNTNGSVSQMQALTKFAAEKELEGLIVAIHKKQLERNTSLEQFIVGLFNNGEQQYYTLQQLLEYFTNDQINKLFSKTKSVNANGESLYAANLFEFTNTYASHNIDQAVTKWRNSELTVSQKLFDTLYQAQQNSQDQIIENATDEQIRQAELFNEQFKLAGQQLPFQIDNNKITVSGKYNSGFHNLWSDDLNIDKLGEIYLPFLQNFDLETFLDHHPALAVAEQKASLLIQLLNSRGQNLTEIYDKLQNLFGETKTKELVSTTDINYSNIQKQANHLLENSNLFASTQYKLQQALEEADPLAALKTLITSTSLTQPDVDKAINYYKEQTEKEISVIKIDESGTLNLEQINKLLEEANESALNTSIQVKNAIKSRTQDEYNVLQKMLEGAPLDQEDITALSNSEVDTTDWESGKVTQQQINSVIENYYNNIKQVPSLLYQFASDMLKYGKLEKFFDAVLDLNKPKADDQARDQAYQQFYQALTQLDETKLDSEVLGSFYQTWVDYIHGALANGYSTVLSAAKELGETAKIDVKDNPALLAAIRSLNLGEIDGSGYKELTDGITDQVIAVVINTGETVRNAVLETIKHSKLTNAQKYATHRDALAGIDTAGTTLSSFLTGTYDDIAEDTILTLAEALGVDYENNYDQFLGQYFTIDGDSFKQTTSQRRALFNAYTNKLNKNQQRSAELAMQKSQHELNKQAALKEVALNWDNLTEGNVERLAKAYGRTMTEMQQWFEYDATTDTYIKKFSLQQFVHDNKELSGDADVEKTLYQRMSERANALKTAFETMNNVIVSSGTARIDVNENTAPILKALSERYGEAIQAATDENGKITQYIIDGSGLALDQVITTLQSLRDSALASGDQDKANLYSDLLKKFRETKLNQSVKTVVDSVLNNYLSVSQESIDKMADKLGLHTQEIAKKDIDTGNYEITLEGLQKIQDALKLQFQSGFITEDYYNSIITKINSIKWQESPTSALANILNNLDGISEGMIDQLAKVTKLTKNQILAYMDPNGENYKMDTSKFEQLVAAAGLTMDQFLTNLFQQKAEVTVDIINSLSSKQTSGTTSYDEMKKVLDSINEGLDDSQKYNFSHIYEYSQSLHAFILTQRGVQLQMEKYNKAIQDAQINSDKDQEMIMEGQRDAYIHSLAEAINPEAYFSATTQMARQQQQQLLQQNIKNYNIGQRAAYGEKAAQISDELVTKMLNGDMVALQQIYTILGKDFTAEQQKSVLNARIDKLQEASEVFTQSVGTLIDETAAQLLIAAGGSVKKIAPDVYQITKALNPDQLADAYMMYYQRLLAQGGTQEQLNEVLKKSWQASTAKQTSIGTILSNAASMTLGEFGDFLLSQGITLSQDIIEQFKNSGIIKVLSSGKIRIANLQAFAKQFNIDTSSQEYIDAYSSLQDTIIEEQTKQRENIQNEINNILQSKPGDLVNVSNLKNLFDGMQNILPQLALYLSDGILEITDNMNLPLIAQLIANACQEAGAIIPEQLREIEEAIEEVLDNFIDLLSNGISGSLSSSDKNNVIKQAQQFLGESLSDNDFIRTADGFKMTTDAAIKMYGALKKVDNVKASKLFDSLNDNLFGSEAGMQTMTGQMGKMAQLQREIDKAKEAADKATADGQSKKAAAIQNTISKLEQELSLYQDIAKARAGGDPSAYDFMGQSLPDYLQGPENYWNAWGNAFNAMRDAAENGGYAIQDFYNIVNEMNNIAALTGKEFTVFGQTLNGGLTGMTALLEKGFSTIKNIDGKGAKVTLEGIGIDFETGAAGMSGNILDGIHEMAASQIQMLDGLIAFLETIVAMESLSGVDTNFSGSLDLGEIFLDTTDNMQKYTAGFNQFRKNMVDWGKESEKNQQILDKTQVKIGDNTRSLSDWLKMSAVEAVDVAGSAQAFTDGWNKFYQLVQSKDFNLEDLFQSNLDLIAQSGLELEYQGPEGKIVIKDGQWIMSNEKGEFVVDGKTFTDAGEALAYKNKKSSEATIKDFKQQITSGKTKDQNRIKIDATKTKQGEITVQAAGLEFNIIPSENKGFLVNGKTQCDTWADVEQEMVNSLNIQREQTGQKLYSTGEARIALGLDVQPEIKSAKDLSSQQVAQLKNANLNTAEQIRKAMKDMGDVEFENKFKFKLAPEGQLDSNFDQDLQERINAPEVQITARLTVSGEQVQVNGGVHVTLIADSVQVPEQIPTSGPTENNAPHGPHEPTLTPPAPYKLVEFGPDGSEIQHQLEPDKLSQNQPDDAELLAAEKAAAQQAHNDAQNMKQTMEDGQEKPQQSLDETHPTGDSITDPNMQLAQDLTNTLETTASDTKDGSAAVVQAVQTGTTATADEVKEVNTKVAQVGDTVEAGNKKQTQATENSSLADHGLTAQDISAAQAQFNQASSAISQTGNAAGEMGTTIQATAAEIQGAAAQVAGALREIGEASASAAQAAAQGANAIRQSYNNMPSGSKTLDVGIQVEVTASQSKNGKVKGWTPRGRVSLNSLAKGNAAMVNGSQKTLMGQLGPELVVSNGHYSLVGQNGAEMVDLADDAIVFNHLQTKRLLSNGRTGRGTPITNQRNAVSWATGNVNGPAMASAAAVLAQLKQIRAMWQAMLNASMKDLGALAGNEGGGGGGGGGKEPPQLKAILNDIERWYNLVRQIDSIEQDITYQETLQNKLQSDRIANGKALYESYKKQIELLDQEIVRNQQLADLQKSWYELRLDEFTASDYGRFYTYDRDTGLMQLKDGLNQGMDALFKLNEKGVYGQTTGAATNAKTQIEYLKSIGFDTEHLMYNGDGTIIDPKAKEYKDNPDKVYEDMMNNFWDNLDGWKQQLDSLYDEYRDQLNTVLQNEDKRNQLLQTIVDNQLSVEQDVLKAIESRQQKLIDELQKQRDAFEESTKDFIDGLNDQLKEQRKMYQNEENEKELVKLRRQVSILQRSGGSASQIRSLQQQIAAKEQDQYFNSQEQQIAAIQKASDLQLKRLDAQIKLMTETLDYQKENGLLWQEVYQIMAGTPQQIRQFIMQNTPDFQSASALDVAEKIRDIDLRINEWTSYRDDENAPNTGEDNYYDWNSFSQSRQWKYGESIWETEQGEQAKAEFDRVLHETGDINAAGRAADAIIDALIAQLSQEELAALGIHAPRMPETEEEGTVPTITGDPRLDELLGRVKTKPRSTGNPNATAIEVMRQPIGKPNTGTKSTPKQTSGDNDKEQQTLMREMDALQTHFNMSMKDYQNAYNNDYDRLTDTNKKIMEQKYGMKKYIKGGLVSYTGLAQVDGTPSRPQAFLNAEQTALLRDNLFGSSNSLLSFARQLVQQLHGTSYSYDTLHQAEEPSINIQNVDVNVNVNKIANDYDVRAIGNTVMQQMVKIARKSGTRGINRR